MDSIIFMDKFRLNLRDIAFLKLKNIYNYCLAFLKRKWINKHFEPNYWSSLLRNHSITHIIQIHTNMIIKIHKYIYVLICFFWYLNWFTWIYINGKFSRGTEWECSGHACYNWGVNDGPEGCRMRQSYGCRKSTHLGTISWISRRHL